MEGFREVKKRHETALWLGGLEAITDGLRDSKNLVLAGAKLAEASLFAAKPSSLSLSARLHSRLCTILSIILRKQNVRLTARKVEIVPDGWPSFFNGRMVAAFQIPGTTPLQKLSLKIDNNSVLAIGPSSMRKVEGMSSGPAAPLLRMAFMAMSSSRVVKGEQQDSAAVRSCSAFFS